GPSVSRRDQENSMMRHARLMLVLFKPWVTVADLKTEHQTWKEALDEFIQNECPQRFQRIIDNMQLLHECRDSRDD
ncbi:hypothetical protein K435DRAFT_592884, partial [Dendrothele bispora CBS 962.96]